MSIGHKDQTKDTTFNYKQSSLFEIQTKVVYTSVADPVYIFRIRIRGPSFKNMDPDPGDPKKTGSGSYLEIFLMFSKINIFYGITNETRPKAANIDKQ